MKMLRKIDVFGYPIRLNFNGDQEIKSTFGGFVSIFAISSWIIFAVIVSLRFFLPSYSNTNHNMISSYTEPADMSIPMNYSNNGLSMYATITKEGTFTRRNMNRFVNISFAYGNDTSKYYIPSVMCSDDLFNFDTELLGIYTDYVKHLDETKTFCPMVDEYRKAVI